MYPLLTVCLQVVSHDVSGIVKSVCDVFDVSVIITDLQVFEESDTFISQNPFNNQIIYGREDAWNFERDQLKGGGHITTSDHSALI